MYSELKMLAHQYGSYDTILSDKGVNASTNADLTIRLRVKLVPKNPWDSMPAWMKPYLPKKGIALDADKTPFEILPWNKPSWESYKRLFLWHRRFWHGKFWLRTPDYYEKLDSKLGKSGYKPNIYCRFELEVSDSNPHKTVEVVRLSKNQVNVPAGEKFDSGTFRSHYELYDNYDVYTRTNDTGGKKYNFYRTITHELGHAIGLGEVGEVVKIAQCVAATGTSDPNYDAFCYGTEDKHYRNVMGYGTKQVVDNARPWQDCIAQHTGTSADDWVPFRKRIYPRTLASVRSAPTSATGGMKRGGAFVMIPD